MPFALCGIGEHLTALGAGDRTGLNEQAANHVIQLLVVQFNLLLFGISFFSSMVLPPVFSKCVLDYFSIS